MTIELALVSSFWEDPASLSVDGEGEADVLSICVASLLAAGYDIQIRGSDGDMVAYEDYDWSDRDV